MLVAFAGNKSNAANSAPVPQNLADAGGQAQSGVAVGVSGNQITLNGVPWLSRGVTLQALVGPAASLKVNFPEIYNALLNYGLPELNAIRAFGADTIRFQVSQPSLDPKNALYDAQ